MEFSLWQLLYFLAVYAILGFIISILYDALMEGRRQRLRICRGPWCPAFGIGALVCIFIMPFIPANPLTAFVVGAGVGSLGEGIVILLTRSLTGERLGRCGWYHFLLYGAGGTILITHLHPLVLALMERLSIWLHFAFLVIFLMYFLADCVEGVAALLEQRKREAPFVDEVNKIVED